MARLRSRGATVRFTSCSSSSSSNTTSTISAISAIPSEFRSKINVVLLTRERTALSDDHVDLLPSLVLCLQTGGHAYHLHPETLTTRGIAVALGRGATAPLHAMPELWTLLTLGTLRAMPRVMRLMREEVDGWPTYHADRVGHSELVTGRLLHGRVVALMGTGRHGARVARVARVFGAIVVGWDREKGMASLDAMPVDASPVTAEERTAILAKYGVRLDEEDDSGAVARLPIDDLLRVADVLSIHLRLSDESRGLVDARVFDRMRPGSILINTARGAIVKEADLVAALQRAVAEPLRATVVGAGLDVFEVEPLPATSPLRTLDTVMLSPHIGWVTDEVFANFAELAARQLEAFVQRTELSSIHWLSPEALETEAHAAKCAKMFSK